MTRLHDPITLRGLEIPNRIWLSPMCQYSAVDGLPNQWHATHYGARAVGGFGLLIAEATGIVPEGRISPKCTGLWNDEQQEAWAGIVDFVHDQGSKMGIQLQHAGRKASTVPMLPDQVEYETETIPVEHGGWQAVGPSPIAADNQLAPRELDRDEIRAIPDQFAAAARRAVEAGFDTVQLHAGHGYLLHQFLSPLSNSRTDSWGGSFDNRTRLIRLVATAVRAAIPEEMPLMARITATDWISDKPSWDADQTVTLVKLLKEAGVDFIDVTTGGLVNAEIPVGPNYQVKFAEKIKREAGIPTSAVGLITEPWQAEAIVMENRADAVCLGREALRNSMWPAFAAREFGRSAARIDFPPQYFRALWRDPK